jgi:aspartate aminotransferase-like enzyme
VTPLNPHEQQAGAGAAPPAPPLLMTPGPTRIPERVLLAGHRVLHHRTPEFSALLAELLEGVRPVFGTASADILPVHGTGRAAMEGAVVNFFRPGDTVVAVCNGRFGEMWAGFAERYGVQVVPVARDWERSVQPDEVAAALDAHPAARAVLVVHSDTSTGVLNPVAEIAAVARARGALVLADGISSIGGAPFAFDAWGLDFAVVSSQKCLMSSPGLALAAVGPRAWEAAERGGMPRSYLDFGAIRRTLAGPRPETPGTTPVLLALQLLEAVRMIHEEGLESVFVRHQAMAGRVRSGAADLGYRLQGSGIRDRSPTLTALQVPEGLEPEALRARIRSAGIQVAGGMERYKASCIRIGHMGDIRMADVERTLEALELATGARGRA